MSRKPIFPTILCLLLFATAVRAADRDDKRLIPELEKAVASGETFAMVTLGEDFLSGYGVKQDFAKAKALFQTATEAGDPAGEQDIGFLYEYGMGVPADLDKAHAIYVKTAEEGNTDAMNCLGHMYRNGHGVTKDYAEALRWYQQAADHGSFSGIKNMAFMYKAGRGVTADPARVFALYKQAAEKGDKPSFAEIALMYETGTGVTVDLVQAKLWTDKLITAEKAHGLSLLGAAWMYGATVPASYIKAVPLLIQAANAGDAEGQYRLAIVYDEAMGVRQDRAEAYKWATLSAAQHFYAADDLLDDLKKSASMGEKSKGQGLARSFKIAPLP